jgi:hypothetical protein
MIKLAHCAGGAPLFKGDVVGHDFRGNQYTAVSAAAEKHSARAKKTALHHDHEVAAETHRIAADMAVRYGIKDRVDVHMLSAKRHDSEALRIRRSQ